MEEIEKLQATLKRRDKSIKSLKEKLEFQHKDLARLQETIMDFQTKITDAKNSMLLFLGLDNLEKDFIEKVEEEFHVVRTQKHWNTDY